MPIFTSQEAPPRDSSGAIFCSNRQGLVYLPLSIQYDTTFGCIITYHHMILQSLKLQRSYNVRKLGLLPQFHYLIYQKYDCQSYDTDFSYLKKIGKWHNIDLCYSYLKKIERLFYIPNSCNFSTRNQHKLINTNK